MKTDFESLNKEDGGTRKFERVTVVAVNFERGLIVVIVLAIFFLNFFGIKLVDLEFLHSKTILIVTILIWFVYVALSKIVQHKQGLPL